MIHFIRHGETVANKEMIWGGDYPLTEKGREQAKTIDAPEVSLILTSGLVRAIETADIIYPGREKKHDPVFREVSFGRMENTPIVLTSPEVHIYTTDPERFSEETGGDNILERSVDALKAALRYYDEEKERTGEDDPEIALVTHRTLMRGMLCVVNHGDLKIYINYELPNLTVLSLSAGDIRKAVEGA